MASGGFAGGLADGINNGMQLYVQKKYYDGALKNREDLNRIREELADAKVSGGSKSGAKGADFTEFDSLAAPIFTAPSSAQSADSQQPIMMDPTFQRPRGFANGGLVMLTKDHVGVPKPVSPGGLGALPKGYATGGMVHTGNGAYGLSSFKPKGYAEGGVVQIPDAVFSGKPEAAYQAAGLASLPSANKPVPPAQEEEQLNPRQRILKEMMFGNLANEPDKLDAIHAAAVMSGVGDKITPWIEGLYKAKKSGKADMAMSLISGDVDGAVDIANRMKTPFADRPKKVNPNDPNDQQWIIQFDGGAPQKIDLRNMIGASMEPEKYLKWQNDTNESVGKRNVSDSAVRANDSIVDVNKARVGKLNEETKSERLGQSSGKVTGSEKPENLDKVFKRRDQTIQDLASIQGDDGKFQVDPRKRLQYSELADDAETMIESRIGRKLNGTEMQLVTSSLSSAPIGDGPGMARWAQALARRFGGVQPSKTQGGPDAPTTPKPEPQPVDGALGTPPPPVAKPAPGLVSQRRPEDVAAPYKGTSYYDSMLSIQRALQNPNLGPQQRQVLALQANEIANRYAKQYGK